MKFDENPLSGSYRHADERTDGQINTKKVMSAFSEYANAPHTT